MLGLARNPLPAAPPSVGGKEGEREEGWKEEQKENPFVLKEGVKAPTTSHHPLIPPNTLSLQKLFC